MAGYTASFEFVQISNAKFLMPDPGTPEDIRSAYRVCSACLMIAKLQGGDWGACDYHKYRYPNLVLYVCKVFVFFVHRIAF